MADKPILFSGPMVRALLAGTKTQTRRAISERTLDAYYAYDEWCRSVSAGVPSSRQWEREFFLERSRIQPGERLYVREHWRVSNRWDSTAPRDLEPRGMSVIYEAGGSASNEDEGWRAVDWPGSRDLWPHWIGKSRRGMHMPRWASRITLTVTDVRVQRLQDISEADAYAEGIPPYTPPTDEHPVAKYKRVWEEINGPGSWDANPWVAAYTFTVALGNIDTLARAA